MKQLQNNFTTPEQSKRLLELGVHEDSADMMYYPEFTENLYSIGNGGFRMSNTPNMSMLPLYLRKHSLQWLRFLTTSKRI